MESQALEKLKEAKRIRAEHKITYIDIMEKMEEINQVSVVSLSTLRRFFRDGSESKASSFNYDYVVCPIYDAVTALAKIPKSDDPHDKELAGYKAVIRVQNEELDRLLELKEHLDTRVDYLVEQSHGKDDLIRRLMKTVEEKDAVIARLMDKCL